MTTSTAITTAPVRQAPALPGDADLDLHTNSKIERRIVWNLIGQLEAAGFSVIAVDDGDERVKCADAMAAMDAVFAVGVAHVFVKKPRHGERWIKLVVGNGEDIVSDWGFSEADRDGFNALIKAFEPENNW
jgi:hypothetical protein